jgi:hypothetical protein
VIQFIILTILAVLAACRVKIGAAGHLHGRRGLALLQVEPRPPSTSYTSFWTHLNLHHLLCSALRCAEPGVQAPAGYSLLTAAGSVSAISGQKSVAQPLVLLPEAFPDAEPPPPPLLTVAAKSGESPAIAPLPAPDEASPGPISVSTTSSYP